MAYEMLLLGAQAASGAFSNYQQNKYNKYGAQIDANQLDIRLAQEQAAATQQATAATKQLQSTLSSQAAIMGARGQRGGGSAFAVQNQSVGNYHADLSALNTNQKFKENEAKLKKSLLRMDVKNKAVQANQTLFGNILNSTSFNSFRTSLGGSRVPTVEAAKPSFVKQGGY